MWYIIRHSNISVSGLLCNTGTVLCTVYFVLLCLHFSENFFSNKFGTFLFLNLSVLEEIVIPYHRPIEELEGRLVSVEEGSSFISIYLHNHINAYMYICLNIYIMNQCFLLVFY
jgi:hypothetical protein